MLIIAFSLAMVVLFGGAYMLDTEQRKRQRVRKLHRAHREL